MTTQNNQQCEDHSRRLDKLEEKSDNFLGASSRMEAHVCRLEKSARDQTKVVFELTNKLSAVDSMTSANMKAIEVKEAACIDRNNTTRWWLKFFMGLIGTISVIGGIIAAVT